MYYTVRDALVSASEDSSVRVIVLYGEGGDFTSGNDVKDFLAFATTKISEENGSEFPAKEFLDVLIPYNKPIIAAVDGMAIGIGATMTMHCDLVYASKEAKFHMPFVNLGLNPEAGTTFFLPKLVGYHNAAEILLSGNMITSQRAYEMGFVNGVVDYTPEEYILSVGSIIDSFHEDKITIFDTVQLEIIEIHRAIARRFMKHSRWGHKGR